MEMNRCFSKVLGAVVRNNPAHQSTCFTACSGGSILTYLPWHPPKLVRVCACACACTHTLTHSYAARATLIWPFHCPTFVLCFLFLQLIPATHPPRDPCLGILNLYKEQMPHTIESSFLFKPRMGTMFVMVGLSPSVLLQSVLDRR